MNTTDRVEDLDFQDKFNDFLDIEMTLGISDKKTIERVKWYYKTYFKKPQSTIPTIQLEEGELDEAIFKMALDYSEGIKTDYQCQEQIYTAFLAGFRAKAAYQQRSSEPKK